MDSNSVRALVENSEIISGSLSVIAALIYAIATIFVGFVAMFGVKSWVREFKGKRQIELAEDSLEFFYKAKDAIASMRNPISEGWKGSTRKVVGEEPDVKKRARDNAYVVYERYDKHVETFNKLYAMRYRFMARIGKETAEPFEQIQKIVNEILIAARMLGQLWVERERRNTPDTTEKLQKSIDRFELIFWYSGSEDDINKRIDKAIADIEQTCNNVIMKDKQKQ